MNSKQAQQLLMQMSRMILTGYYIYVLNLAERSLIPILCVYSLYLKCQASVQFLRHAFSTFTILYLFFIVL